MKPALSDPTAEPTEAHLQFGKGRGLQVSAMFCDGATAQSKSSRCGLGATIAVGAHCVKMALADDAEQSGKKVEM
eukprot:6515094-Prymnesium_polylepis.1